MKILNLSLFMYVIFILTSCSAVNHIGDKALLSNNIPKVKITNPPDNVYVDGGVSIIAELAGVVETDIDRVEFYAGGELVFIKKEYPYICYWDTTANAEGPVEVRVKAYNKKGIFSEAVIYVRVSRAIFVADYGNDTNDGTGNHPCRNIQHALLIADETGKRTIYVSEGKYLTNIIISITNNNMRLIGGYSSDFSEKTGYSEIDGNNGPNYIHASGSNLYMEGFKIYRVSSPLIQNNLFSLNDVNNSMFTNIIIFNNSISIIIGMSHCNSNFISVEIYNNQNPPDMLTCPIINLVNSSFNKISCDIISNTNNFKCGGVSIMNGNNNTITSFIKNNYGIYGGGIYIQFSSENTISSSIINNSSYYAGGIYIIDSTNTKVINCVITNNYSSQSNVSVFLKSTAGSPGLVISNCLIGGTNGSAGYAVYEDGTFDTTGHYLLNNIFLTNTMKYLYRDFSGTNISNANWACINDTGYTGAFAASGNTVQ